MSDPLAIIVSPLAKQQIDKEDAWWRANRPAAPNAIREEIERIAAILSFQPSVGPIARNVTLSGVRRIHLDRVHCHLYYRVAGSPRYVEIVGFWGSRRGSDPPI
ncbi:MAG TPA: type II toxin-antitoxin system RelE/ParE family toxin [Thermoanaerobaculia bacterium]